MEFIIRIQTIVCTLLCIGAGCDSPSEDVPATSNAAKSVEETPSVPTTEPPLLGSPEWKKEFKVDWDKNIQIQPGMTVEELDRHLQLFVEMIPHADGENAPVKLRRFMATGQRNFWMDLTIEEGRVKSITITPGNMTVMLEPFLLAGESPHL